MAGELTSCPIVFTPVRHGDGDGHACAPIGTDRWHQKKLKTLEAAAFALLPLLLEAVEPPVVVAAVTPPDAMAALMSSFTLAMVAGGTMALKT
jgi:hypothetical protein